MRGEQRAAGGRALSTAPQVVGGRENGLTKAVRCVRYVTALKILSEKYVSTSRALKYCHPTWLMHELKKHDQMYKSFDFMM